MNQPLSSFYNLTVTSNIWTSGSDLKAKFGSLDVFESHYNFVASWRDTQEQEFDFTARFNATDELESHYNFFAQWLVYDKEYEFTARVVPLEMEIEYEDESDIVAVVRTAEVSKPDKAIVNAARNAILVSNNAIKHSRIYEAYIDNLQKADLNIVKPTIVEASVDSSVADELAVVVEESYQATADDVLDVTIDSRQDATSINDLTSEIVDANIGTTSRKLPMNIEVLNQADKLSEIFTTIDSSEKLHDASDVEIVIDQIVRLKRIEERMTEVDEVLRIGFAPMDTVIEETMLGDRLANEIASIESVQLLQGSAINYSEIEGSTTGDVLTNHVIQIRHDTRGEIDTQLSTDLIESVTANRIEDVLTELDLVASGEVLMTHVTELECDSEAESLTTHAVALENHTHGSSDRTEYVEVERFIDSENLTEYETEMERTTKASPQSIYKMELHGIDQVERAEDVNVELDESIDMIGAAMATELEDSTTGKVLTEYNAAVGNAYNFNVQIERDAELQDSQTGRIQIEHPAEIADNALGNTGNSLETDISMKETGNIKTGYESTIETPQSGEVIHQFGADISGPHKAIADVLYDSYIDTHISSSKRIDDILADLENSVISEATNNHTADIEIPSKGEVDTSYQATIEDFAKARRVEEKLSEIEKHFGGEVIGEYASEIEGVQQVGGHEDKPDKDRLVWLIMGRPSWIHQYWQRTTR